MIGWRHYRQDDAVSQRLVSLSLPVDDVHHDYIDGQEFLVSGPRVSTMCDCRGLLRERHRAPREICCLSPERYLHYYCYIRS